MKKARINLTETLFLKKSQAKIFPGLPTWSELCNAFCFTAVSFQKLFQYLAYLKHCYKKVIKGSVSERSACRAASAGE